jgi:hypothetical protein
LIAQPDSTAEHVYGGLPSSFDLEARKDQPISLERLELLFRNAVLKFLINGGLAQVQQSSAWILRNISEIFTVFCLTQSSKHRSMHDVVLKANFYQ